MAINKTEQAKKPGKKASLHTEPVHDLAPMVDWDEQERIRKSLKAKFIPPIVLKGGHRNIGYTPEEGAEICIMRRQGMSGRRIAEVTGHPRETIKHWLADYPEFAQEWNDAYADYITDVAEGLVPIAENLMKELRYDGKKLSPKQQGRYIRALQHLSLEAHWAATHRVPALYGDTDNGMELVLIQPTVPERSVTQDVPRAEAWRKEAEDAEVAESSPLGADGTGGDAGGQADLPGSTGGGVPLPHEGGQAVRRHKGGSRPLVKRSKRKPAEEPGAGGD